MKTVKSAAKTWLASVSVLVLASLLVPVCAMAQNAGPFPTINGVPQVVNPQENEFQRQTHFLTFIGSFIPESANSIAAYYATIDPYNTKPTFPQWLKNAGFISNVNDWNPSGPQKIACDLGTAAGCDMTSAQYRALGNHHGIILTDSHAIVLNAADLGFVRNQFIRCVDPANLNSTSPCKAPNPILYTYLENYPVAFFATSTTPGNSNPSGFPVNSGYPNQIEAAAAINSAINRPLGDGNTARFADVAFEWAPPATNLTSSTRFGQLYAYEVGTDAIVGGNVTETLNFRLQDLTSTDPKHRIINFVKGDGSTNPIIATDKFAPNLDGIGNKYHPGNCLTCHGGAPAFVPSGGPYPRAGNISGFRFLPLDNTNLLFTSDHAPGDPLSRASQEAQIKEYNLAVLRTVPTGAENDGTGATRVAHLREVITGWYASFDGDQSFGRSTQKSDFIPKGWRDVTHGGTAPVGAEDVYLKVVGPSCRSCHFNRELSLDFGTYANFHQESDLQQLALIPACKQNNPDPPDPGAKFMPLAFLTFNRFWQTQAQSRTLPPNGDSPFTVTLDHEVDKLAADFGFGSVNGYCATNP